MLATPATACAVRAYAPAGRMQPSGTLRGPGLLLEGGGRDLRRAWIWMHDTLVGRGVRGGNVVVLRAGGDDDYDAWAYRLAPFASVRTVVIPPCAARSQIDAAARYVDRADAVFFAGGDQANYVAWKGSALTAAVERVYRRGGVVGGTSAGLAIQGAVVFDSVAADRVLPDDRDVRSADAVRDPFEPSISFTRGFFSWRPLARTITDTHFARRNRFGRLAAFMARTQTAYGLGIDEGSALLVNARGLATLVMGSERGYRSRGAYVLLDGRTERLSPGKPLRYSVRVVHLNRTGETYDLPKHPVLAPSYRVTVDGLLPRLYSVQPY